MASSSSLTSGDEKKRYEYDVFLSFSGEDTRRSFVDHLNEALKRHGIRTFKDDERLQKGKAIKEELMKSIEDSRLYVIVFSKKYAASSWCLDELVKMMECQKKRTDQTAFPVFYDVEPTEVRKQIGSVGEAFAKHADKKVVVGTKLTRNVVGKALARHTSKKVGNWKKALKDAANLSGWDLKNTAHGHEAKVIKLVVERVSLELRSINLGVDETLIGMERRMQDLDPYLDIGSNDVRMIGIKGMGGAGKTTLARAIYDRISRYFEGKSFVENVRENSQSPLLALKKLQEQVLTDVLQDECISVSSVHEGTKFLKTMLGGKKVLVVLDDVDHKDQLDALAGKTYWFKPGSRIIITTRDEQVLIAHGVKFIRDVDLLSDEEAIRLFSMHAFLEDIPPQDYQIQSLDKVISYAAGLPLTIKVLGSFLCGKTKHEWIDALARLKTIPLHETLRKLELSYESLEDDCKQIFLDVACLRSYMMEDETIRMLESCGFHARNGLRVLQQKSFITIGKIWSGIHMHDHFQEMARNIVRREHPDEPHKHSRLWVQEEIEPVLANCMGTEATRCIELEITPDVVLEGLENMRKLRCFIVRYVELDYDFVKIDEARQYFPNSLQYLCWYQYPHCCLPKSFEPNNLVALNMSYSKITHLWEGERYVMKKLKFLCLDDSKLKSLDLGLTPNLENLSLDECEDLEKLDVHGGCLKTLVYLNLTGCRGLKSFSFIRWFESLEVLQVRKLNLTEFPDYIIAGNSANSLLELRLSVNNIEQVPSSIGNLHNLVTLVLYRFPSLKSLEGSICTLQNLRSFRLEATNIERLPDDIGQLKCLENLELTDTCVQHLPGSIYMLKHLKTLYVRVCLLFEELSEDVSQLECLEELDLQFCSNLKDIPSSISKLKQLKLLRLRGCVRLERLPENLGNLECLQELDIRGSGITHLPLSISNLAKGGLKIYGSEFDGQILDEVFI